MATPPAPRIRVFRIPFFLDPQQLRSVSCLQMSDTGLYLNWKLSSAYDEQVDDGEMDDNDDDDELNPEIQENVFWESIAHQAPIYISKELSSSVCYKGNSCSGFSVLQNGDYVVHTYECTFLYSVFLFSWVLNFVV